MGSLEDERPPGPARDLVDLLAELRRRQPQTLGQLAVKTDLSRAYLSEVLCGIKTPSPAVAARLAEALGGDQAVVAKAVRYAEELAELNSYQRRQTRHSAQAAEQTAQSPKQTACGSRRLASGRGGRADPGLRSALRRSSGKAWKLQKSPVGNFDPNAVTVKDGTAWIVGGTPSQAVIERWTGKAWRGFVVK